MRGRSMFCDPLSSWGDEIAAILQEDEVKDQRRATARDAANAKQQHSGSPEYGSRPWANNQLTWDGDSSSDQLIVLHRYKRDPSGEPNFQHDKSQSGSYSLTVFPDSDRAHALSPNDPLYVKGGGSHDRFSAYTVLEHNGDIKAAMRALLAKFPDPTIGNAFVGIPMSSNEQPPASTRFRLRTVLELLATRPKPWLVDSMIPANSIGCIYGESGSGKSFFALNLVQSLAEGTPYFDHKIAQSTKIVYIALEGRSGLCNRIRALELSEAALANVHLVLDDFNLRCIDQVDELAQMILATCGPGAVVIVDTLNQATVGAEENSSRDMGEALAGIKSLQAVIGGTVIIVHHAGKDAARGMRGHSLLFAAMDFVIAVERKGKDRSWRLSKSKDGDELGSYPFALVPYTVGMDEDGQPITTCMVKPMQLIPTSVQPPSPLYPTGDALTALNVLKQLIGETPSLIQNGASRKEWRAAFNSAMPNKTSEAQRKAFDRAIEVLLHNGWVVQPHPAYFRDAKGGDL